MDKFEHHFDTPNAGHYELTGDQRCITTAPRNEAIIVYYPNGDVGRICIHDAGGYYLAYAWSPITPAKKKRWRASLGRPFFYIDTFQEIKCRSDDRDHYDNKHYESGNYFQTREEAKASSLYKAFEEMREAHK